MKFRVGETYRTLYFSTMLFSCVLVIGTLGYPLLVDNITFFDAFYMTIITISTIGYGEMFDLTGNVPARLFTIFLAFSGIGLLTYLLSNIAAALLEGKINKSFKISRMESKIDKMSGHFIICGMGRVGNYILKDLEADNYEIVCADMDEEAVNRSLLNHPDIPALVGDCTEDDFLIKLGIKRAKGIFVTTHNDNVNLMVVLTARQLNTYVKIVSVSHFRSHEKKLRAVGANSVISPSQMGALRMAGEMTKPNVSNFLDIMLSDEEKNLNIEEINMGPQCAGKRLEQFIEQKDGLILAVKEQERWEFNPKRDYLLTPYSIVVILTTPDKKILIEKKI